MSRCLQRQREYYYYHQATSTLTYPSLKTIRKYIKTSFLVTYKLSSGESAHSCRPVEDNEMLLLLHFSWFILKMLSELTITQRLTFPAWGRCLRRKTNNTKLVLMRSTVSSPPHIVCVWFKKALIWHKSSEHGMNYAASSVIVSDILFDGNCSSAQAK